MLCPAGWGVVCYLLMDLVFSYRYIEPNSLLICLIVLPLFMLCSQSARIDRMAENRLVQTISRHSLMIYLIHPFWLNILRKVCGIHLADFTPAAGILLMTAVALAGSLLSSWIISKTPLLKKL